MGEGERKSQEYEEGGGVGRSEMHQEKRKGVKGAGGKGRGEGGEEQSKRTKRGLGRNWDVGSEAEQVLARPAAHRLLEHLHPGGGVSKWSCCFPGFPTRVSIPAHLPPPTVLDFPLSNQPHMPK